MTDKESIKSNILLYQTEDGLTHIEVKLKDETVWLSQTQMAELFQKDKRTISEHIANIYEEGELMQEPTIRHFQTVQQESLEYLYKTITANSSANAH